MLDFRNPFLYSVANPSDVGCKTFGLQGEGGASPARLCGVGEAKVGDGDFGRSRALVPGAPLGDRRPDGLGGRFPNGPVPPGIGGLARGTIENGPVVKRHGCKTAQWKTGRSCRGVHFQSRVTARADDGRVNLNHVNTSGNPCGFRSILSARSILAWRTESSRLPWERNHRKRS